MTGRRRTGARPIYALFVILAAIFLAGCGSDFAPPDDSANTAEPIIFPTPFPTPEPLRERLPDLPSSPIVGEECPFAGQFVMYTGPEEAAAQLEWSCSGELIFHGKPVFNGRLYGSFALPGGGYVFHLTGCVLAPPSGGEIRDEGEFESSPGTASLYCDVAPSDGALVLRARGAGR